MAQVKIGDTPVNTNGELPAIGSQAPDFHLVDGKLNDKHMADFAGKQIIMAIVPSLDTGVCQTMAKTFSARVAGRDDVAVLVISSDLPFAQERFCSAGGAENVVTLSLMRSRAFAKDYGVLMTDGPLAGITARAVVVVGADGIVKYTQLVPVVGTEPDYDAALAALG